MVLPAMTPVNHSNDQNDKIFLRVQQWLLRLGGSQQVSSGLTVPIRHFDGL